ncbi:MAG TPA: MarR family transcriptional regulator [Thermoanaerobaculia bacterium]
MLVQSLQRELKQTRPFAHPAQEAAVSLMRTADLIRRTVSIVVEAQGITTQQYNVLRILRGAGERGLPTLEIAERMVEQTPGITRLIDRLEAKQLVSRERCTTDRRQVFCCITRQGLAMLDQLDEPLHSAEAEALSGLNAKELAQLVELLDRTRTGLHAAIESRRPNHS